MTGKIIKRHLQADIESWMNQGKVIVIYGARQVGKTTLSKRLAAKYDGVFLNCERGSVKNLLQSRNISQFQLTLGERNCVILDEAQRNKKSTSSTSASVTACFKTLRQLICATTSVRYGKTSLSLSE